MANKENVGECPPPKKKHRLSLSLKHKPLVPQQETRFAEPVSEYEVKLASKGVVPDNTKRNNEWAARNFADWSRARSEKVKDDPVPQDLLNCKDPELLCKWLCIYVMETRQESGKPYPPTSIYGLLCGILRIVRGNGVPFNFLDKSDIRFRDLHQTLDRVCCDLHSKGVGADKESASVISFEDEDLFWETGAVGFETPRSLLNLVFYYVGLHFCLRGG